MGSAKLIRDAVSGNENRRMGSSDPQRMDFRAIVQRRLIALNYVMDDSGNVVDNTGATIVAADDTSGTGQTPAELASLGYTPDQIAGLAGSTSSNVYASGSVIGAAPLTGASTPTSNGSFSWISGLAGLFGSVATGTTNLLRATNNPAINPATGVRYGINPATGLPYPAVTAQTQSSLLILAVVAVVFWLLFRKA